MLASFRREIRMASMVASCMLLIALATGCGSGGGSDTGFLPVDLAAMFSESGTAGAADVIRLVGNPTGDLVTVEVVIGGPTTSTDFYSFVFDLVVGDPGVVEFVEGSATAGTALTTSGSQGLQVLATGQGARTTIGVTKLGVGPGNGITDPGEAVVIGLVFRALQPGATTLTIEGSPGNDPTALDSAGAAIDSVTFDPVTATLGGV